MPAIYLPIRTEKSIPSLHEPLVFITFWEEESRSEATSEHMVLLFQQAQPPHLPNPIHSIWIWGTLLISKAKARVCELVLIFAGIYKMYA